MPNGPYFCRGDDKEDLSEQVLRAIRASEDTTLEIAAAALRRGQRKRRWRVVGICSKGHENIFEGTYDDNSGGEPGGVVIEKVDP